MTRIIGGVAGGRPIRTPSGGATRPTSDRVREALFSSLESSLGTLHGVAFLDVFAGSGAVGLEAASRGAASVAVIERNRDAAALIASNARSLGLADVHVISGSVIAVAQDPPSRAFSVAFLDPPYDLTQSAVARALDALATGRWFDPGALVVVERSRRSGDWRWPAGFVALRDRRYGDTVLWYGRWQEPPAGGEPPREDG